MMCVGGWVRILFAFACWWRAVGQRVFVCGRELEAAAAAPHMCVMYFSFIYEYMYHYV